MVLTASQKNRVRIEEPRKEVLQGERSDQLCQMVFDK